MFNPTCIFHRAELADGLRCAKTIIKSKMPQPWLSCCKFSATERGMLLEATDQIQYLAYEIQNVDVDQWNDVLLPHEQLSDIARELTDDNITLTLEGEYGKIKAKGAAFELWTQPPEKFAAYPAIDPEGASSFTMRSNDLKRALQQTTFATGPSDVGRNWKWEAVAFIPRGTEKVLHIVGLDGKRGGLAIIPLVADVATRALVHPTTLKIVEQTIPDDAEVMISISANLIEFKCDFLTIRSTQIDGGYPDHMVIFGGDAASMIRVDREMFRQRLRQVLLVLQDDDAKRPEITLVAENKQIVMRGKSIRGDGTVKLDALEQRGASWHIPFNARWMLEGINQMTGKNLDIDMIVKNNVPAAVRVSDGEGYKYCVAAIAENAEVAPVKKTEPKTEAEPAEASSAT